MNDEHQRITLQYTINLSELPRETERLQENIIEALGKLALTKLSGEQILQLSSAQELEALRFRLRETDVMIADLHSIVSSYLQLQVAAEDDLSMRGDAPTPRHTTFDDRGEPVVESPGPTTLDDLNATLTQLKGNLENAPNPS